HSILTVLAIAFFLASPVFAQKKPLDDKQLDLVTAGASFSNSSSGRVNGHGGVVDNSVNVDSSGHYLGISRSDVDIRSATSTVGSSNNVVSGMNVMGVIGRSPGSSSSGLGSSQPVRQTNIYY
ncbi:MAG: hypothetical protein AAGU11_07615, partial [Syntrophobacteraceae bacterium]